VNADFIDDEDLEKKVLPYIMQHSTPDDQSTAATMTTDKQEGVVPTEIPHAACADSNDEEAEDAAWFQLFALLERYGSPGMLERAFATPAATSVSDDILI